MESLYKIKIIFTNACIILDCNAEMALQVEEYMYKKETVTLEGYVIDFDKACYVKLADIEENSINFEDLKGVQNG